MKKSDEILHELLRKSFNAPSGDLLYISDTISKKMLTILMDKVLGLRADTILDFKLGVIDSDHMEKELDVLASLYQALDMKSRSKIK